MAVRTAYDPTAGEVLTATNLERLAGGWIGYVERTSNINGITLDVDLTGLSVTVTVGTSRRIRVSFKGRITNGTASPGAEGGFVIREGTTKLAIAQIVTESGAAQTVTTQAILTPTAGSHTYKISGWNGTNNLVASAEDVGYILVEDLGPAT